MSSQDTTQEAKNKMELTKKQRTIKYICCFAIILLADLFQNVSGLLPEIGGARCFILLPIAIIFAMGENILSASLIGLFAGLLWDLSGAVHLGFNCIFITVFCLCASILTTYIARDTFITNMVMTVFTIILYCIIYWLCFIVIRGTGDNKTIFTFYLPCAIYTALISPILWLILDKLKKKLNPTPKLDF